MKRIILLVALVTFLAVARRLPILKTKIGTNDFYYKDMLGFVYTRRSSCGWIGPCTYWDVPLWGTHSLTFRTIKYDGPDCLDTYAKTNKAVYYLGKKQTQVKDPKSFNLISNFYARDSLSVYKLCDLEPLVEDKVETFETVGPVCAKSLSSVYCFDKIVRKADPQTFEHIWRGFYKDRNHVYNLGQVLEGIDPSTFEILSWGYIKDAQEIYFFDESAKLLTRLDSVDINNFEVLTQAYAKDQFRVYKEGKVLEGTNPKSFEIPKN